jgi:hypothetical protein
MRHYKYPQYPHSPCYKLNYIRALYNLKTGQNSYLEGDIPSETNPVHPLNPNQLLSDSTINPTLLFMVLTHRRMHVHYIILTGWLVPLRVW